MLLESTVSEEESPTLYHDLPERHRLERRASFSQDFWNSLTQHLPAGPFLVGLSSVFWQEAWEYGERAFRYYQHEFALGGGCDINQNCQSDPRSPEVCNGAPFRNVPLTYAPCEPESQRVLVSSARAPFRNVAFRNGPRVSVSNQRHWSSDI